MATRKRARQRKDGVVLPLGTAINCALCEAPIIRSGGNKRFCEDCARKQRQKRDLEDYYRGQGRQPPVVGAGAEFKCVRCGVSITKTRADHQFCDACTKSKANELTRKKRESDRRASGVRRRSGLELKCVRCGGGIISQSHNHKYCKSCDHEPVVRYIRNRKKIDSGFALNYHMGSAIRKSLSRGAKAGRRWEGLVGYTTQQLVRHLERQFVEGMSWDNRILWHIDHILPLRMFKFKKPDDPDFKAAWALNNLRPLWKSENLNKNSQRLHLI